MHRLELSNGGVESVGGSGRGRNEWTPQSQSYKQKSCVESMKSRVGKTVGRYCGGKMRDEAVARIRRL